MTEGKSEIIVLNAYIYYILFTISLCRTGKRTQWGLIMDGWNSLIRYYKNNFSDGFRQVSKAFNHGEVYLINTVVHCNSCPPFLFQDAIDLFLGNYSVDEVEPASPLHVKKDWKFLAVSMETLFVIRETQQFSHWLHYA